LFLNIFFFYRVKENEQHLVLPTINEEADGMPQHVRIFGAARAASDYKVNKAKARTDRQPRSPARKKTVNAA